MDRAKPIDRLVKHQVKSAYLVRNAHHIGPASNASSDVSRHVALRTQFLVDFSVLYHFSLSHPTVVVIDT
jgi:hypothetical protein